MESVEAELPVLINLLLQAPADAQRRLIEKYFLPECRLTHALVRLTAVTRLMFAEKWLYNCHSITWQGCWHLHPFSHT